MAKGYTLLPGFQPFIFEQSKIVLVLKVTTEEYALAQISFICEAQLE